MFSTKVDRINDFPPAIINKCVTKTEPIDSTLEMTAIALLHNRVEDLKISICVSNAENLIFLNHNKDVYSFHWFYNAKNPDELLKSLKSFKTIEKLPTHEKFLSDKLGTQIYIRLMPEENTVCFFSSQVTVEAWHCVQFFIPKYFKVFKDKPLTKTEISFLETLTFKSSVSYITRLTELVHTESFRVFVLKDSLAAFEKKLFERKVTYAQNRLGAITNEMTQAMEKYRQACEQRIEALALVNGLKTMADQIDEHTELQDYLLNNQRICNVTLNDTIISFIVKTYLAPHHIEEWELITRREQYFKPFVTNEISNPEDIKLLLDAILSENRSLRVQMCAYFELDYFGSTATSRRNYNFVAADSELKDYIPNPHLHYNNCFGQNKLAILTQLTNGDAIGAIECSIACAQRINILEGVNFVPFVRDLLTSKGKCIVADDGTKMTASEAIAYLKGKKND